MTDGFVYVSLRQRPELVLAAARWFHEKWGVPAEAYLDCMEAYLDKKTENGWYLCLFEGQIVGGLGVIDNDFHDRKDLSPNVCAVYTEEAFRGRGVAGRLLGLAVEDMRSNGVSPCTWSPTTWASTSATAGNTCAKRQTTAKRTPRGCISTGEPDRSGHEMTGQARPERIYCLRQERTGCLWNGSAASAGRSTTLKPI